MIITILKKIKSRLSFLFFQKQRVKRKRKYQHFPSSKNAFFIMGSGRNGSTLLALLLNKHSDVFLPPEQYALPYTLSNWYLPFYNLWSIYCQKSVQLYFSHNQNWTLTDNDKNKIISDIKQFSPKQQNPVNIFTTIFSHYSRKIKGKEVKLIGDHSPITTMFYEYIVHHFCHSKYIFLLRHPLDVVVSYKKLKNNPASISEIACQKWNNSIKAYDYLKKHNYPVLLIKYEYLVEEPNKVIMHILQFLELEEAKYDYSMINNNETQALHLGVNNVNYHKNLFKPITNASVGKWKRSLSPQEINKLIPIIETNAKRFNYNLSKNE
jgi:hypothetical protein